jgi:two-component system nitrogen regulation response regulator GlnG
MTYKVLVIDDEPSIRYSMEQVFARQDIGVFTAATAEEGIRLVSDEIPDVVLLDIRLGNQDGLEVFEKLRERDAKCLVIFITGHGTSETAIEAMKIGAYDYLVKPLDADQLQQVVRQACEISRLMKRPAIIEEGEGQADRPDLLIGSGSAMRTACKQIGRVAGQDVNVLVLGESGTGKELVARAVYHHSRRNEKPFLAINCAALTESLLESELFGHEKGAFTGADRRRIGKFEQADGGTVFLDEVGDMSAGTQAKMLRLLQEGRFERVGGNESIATNVRIVSATNKNLEAMIAQSRFRLDLYYRLRGVSIQIPPLRERREDIPELAHYFLFRFNRELRTSVNSIAEETLERLCEYPWPGNVRELQNSIREALICSAGPTLLPEFLPQELTHEASFTPISLPPTPAGAPTWREFAQEIDLAFRNGEPGIHRQATNLLDHILVTMALAKANDNQSEAADLLGISRPTLRAKMRALHGTTSNPEAAD